MHRLLFVHADCRDRCVGKEIPWPGKEADAFDQTWFSDVDQRRWSFSSFAYAYISFDLVLDGWIDRPNSLTMGERKALAEFPRMRTLINECQSAAENDKNRRVLDLLPVIRSWLDTWQECIGSRIEEDKLVT